MNRGATSVGSHGLMGLGEVHSCGRHSRQRIALHDLSGASGFAPLSGQQLCDRNKINRIKAQPGSDRGQLVRRHNLKTLRELRKIFEANIPDYADMQFKDGLYKETCTLIPNLAGVTCPKEDLISCRIGARVSGQVPSTNLHKR